MSEELETKWFDGAIDDGTITVESSTYAIEISSDRAETIHTQPTSIRYTPEINSAKRATFSVPPDDRIVGEEYLGGNLKLIIDGKGEMDFDIRRIETNQNEGEDYQIRAFSKGQKLAEIATEKSVDNEISFDYIAELVDASNDSPNDFDRMFDTEDEQLTDIINKGGDVLGVSPSTNSGTALYQNVGENASNLDVIYAKLYVEGIDTVEVTISSDNANEYIETYSGLDDNVYGHWVAIRPENEFEGDESSYSVEFELQNEALLIDWRSIHNEEISREVLTPSIETVSENEELYSVTGSEFQEEIASGQETQETTVIYDEEEEVYRTRRVSYWDVPVSGDAFTIDDENATGGGAYFFERDSLNLENTFFVEDDFPTWQWWARTKIREEYDNDNGLRLTIRAEHDGTGSTETFGTFEPSENYEWLNLAESSFFMDWPEPIDSDSDNGAFTIETQVAEDSQYDIEVCSFVLIIGRENQDGLGTWQPNYTFDNELHESGGHLDSPQEYLGEDTVEFDSFVSQTNISKATVDANFTSTTEANDNWGPVQRIDDGNSFPETFPNSDTVTNDFVYAGVSHGTKFLLSGRGERNTDTPRRGFNEMELESFSVNVDTNDLSVLYDQSVSGNNLRSMSTIADDTDAIFRFEDSKAKIFQFGELTTSPNLKKEDISSTVSTEDAYSSVEVIGLHNVRSGKIESDKAPEWLDRHKEIRDDSVESTEEATSRALSFLRKNGTVQYSGDITTLPTFAPVGEMVDGEMFSHGKDMVIQSVRYTKNRTVLSLGFELDVGSEMYRLEVSQDKSKNRETGEGMTIPVGEGNV